MFRPKDLTQGNVGPGVAMGGVREEGLMRLLESLRSQFIRKPGMLLKLSILTQPPILLDMKLKGNQEEKERNGLNIHE